MVRNNALVDVVRRLATVTDSDVYSNYVSVEVSIHTTSRLVRARGYAKFNPNDPQQAYSEAKGYAKAKGRAIARLIDILDTNLLTVDFDASCREVDTDF